MIFNMTVVLRLIYFLGQGLDGELSQLQETHQNWVSSRVPICQIQLGWNFLWIVLLFAMTIQFCTHLLSQAAYFSLDWCVSQLPYGSFPCALNTPLALIWTDLEVNLTTDMVAARC